MVAVSVAGVGLYFVKLSVEETASGENQGGEALAKLAREWDAKRVPLSERVVSIVVSDSDSRASVLHMEEAGSTEGLVASLRRRMSRSRPAPAAPISGQTASNWQVDSVSWATERERTVRAISKQIAAASAVGARVTVVAQGHGTEAALEAMRLVAGEDSGVAVPDAGPGKSVGASPGGAPPSRKPVQVEKFIALGMRREGLREFKPGALSYASWFDRKSGIRKLAQNWPTPRPIQEKPANVKEWVNVYTEGTRTGRSNGGAETAQVEFVHHDGTVEKASGNDYFFDASLLALNKAYFSDEQILGAVVRFLRSPSTIEEQMKAQALPKKAPEAAPTGKLDSLGMIKGGSFCEKPPRTSPPLEWVRIPGDSLMFERPVPASSAIDRRSVNIRSFEMAKTEVTKGQYKECVLNGPCTEPTCNWPPCADEDTPVVCVNWFQARAYSKWVAGRLPSESEWEFAAKNGPLGKGVKATCENAITFANGTNFCGKEAAWPVCSRPLGNSSHGICDLIGNAADEWVQDSHHLNYEGAPADGSAWDGPENSERVRKSSPAISHYNAKDKKWELDSVGRSWYAPDDQRDYIGFRPARDVSH